MRSMLAVSLLLWAVTPVLADEMVCATSPEHNEFLRGVGAWSAARAREVAVKGTGPAATRHGDVFLLPADATNAPFRRPFDLHGRTLIFERENASAFSVRNVPLEWEGELGTRVDLEPAAGESRAVVALGFDFPFFGGTRRTLYVTGYNAIYFEPPRVSSARQYGDVDLAMEPQPVIAPLLATSRSRLAPVPQVYVRQNADSAAITWISPDRYTVRATLRSSGEIRFSYHTVTERPAAASVVITSGNEAWRSRRTTLASKSDPSGDVTGIPAAVAAMLDITNVSLEQIDGRDLFQVRVRTRSPVDHQMLSGNDFLQFDARFGSSVLRYSVSADGTQKYSLPVWGNADASSSVRREGDQLVLSFLGEHLEDPSAVPLSVWAYRNGSRVEISDSFTVSLPDPQKRVRTDFSGASDLLLDGPIAEAFTAPVLSVYRVWDQILASDPSLNDEGVDGVAIYQNFFTDLVTFAGAYSTGGHAGVSGLYPGDAQWLSQPRSPALMHMNTLGYGHNSTLQGASRVVLHELGHRWLMFVSLLENGSATRKLNPVSAHPAQYVDTRAAFSVFTDRDTSVMGGGWFSDNGDGSYTTGEYGPYGYSWLDLYLMGLAGESEVPSMFYLDNSNPVLGGEYYAPPNETFQATRRDFTLQQVVGATGARHPQYPSTQRSFRVVFVLMTDPDRPVSEEDLIRIDSYRKVMERDFPIATGGRGSVVTSITPPAPGPRRRVAPK